jgi:hypothetical protein
MNFLLLLGCLGDIAFWVLVIQWLTRDRDTGGPRSSPDGDFESLEDALPFLRFPVDGGADGTRNPS